MHADLESAKKDSQVVSLFYSFGISRVKGARWTLMKLTPGQTPLTGSEGHLIRPRWYVVAYETGEDPH